MGWEPELTAARKGNWSLRRGNWRLGAKTENKAPEEPGTSSTWSMHVLKLRCTRAHRYTPHVLGSSLFSPAHWDVSDRTSEAAEPGRAGGETRRW